MRTRHLNRLLIVAILLISTAPLYAQRQQQNVAKLKADARNLVGIIGGDKTRTQCPYRKSNSNVLMVQSAEVRLGNDAANGLNLPRNRCILV
jgi:hypothetical protein